MTTHVREDTIAKWTGHLWVSPKNDFQFDEKDLDRYRGRRALSGYLDSHPNTSVVHSLERRPGARSRPGRRGSTSGCPPRICRRMSPTVSTRSWWTGGSRAPDEEYTVLITTALAQKYRLNVGDSIICFIPSAFGARNAMDFTITGIYRASAPWYDSGITIRVQDFVTMRELGDAFPFRKAYVKDEAGIPAMVKDLAALAPDFQVKGYRDDTFVRFLLSLGITDIMFFGFMAMIIFLALLIGIRSVVLTNIFDRRDEIGTLRALGFPKGTVRNLFFGESLVELLAGYVLGAAAVVVAGGIFEARIVRPPLLMLQYMFGMTRMRLTLNAFALVIPLFLLLFMLFLTTFRTVGKETEKQAVAADGESLANVTEYRDAKCHGVP